MKEHVCNKFSCKYKDICNNYGVLCQFYWCMCCPNCIHRNGNKCDKGETKINEQK